MNLQKIPLAVLSLLGDWIYPRACLCCGGRIRERRSHICWDCRAGFPVITEPFCSICGDPADGRVEQRYSCSYCRRRAPYFTMARSAVRFRGPVRDAIHTLKYGATPCLGRDLAQWLVACHTAHFANRQLDAVICVPLYPARQRDRTYNQSALLARELARQIGIPAQLRCLRRTRPTATQISLNARQRRVNVEGAFAVRHPEWVQGRRLLLVDDVMTTGATCNEAARVLKDAGATDVCVITVARG
jgi:competence protein ComFC